MCSLCHDPRGTQSTQPVLSLASPSPFLFSFSYRLSASPSFYTRSTRRSAYFHSLHRNSLALASSHLTFFSCKPSLCFLCDEKHNPTPAQRSTSRIPEATLNLDLQFFSHGHSRLSTHSTSIVATTTDSGETSCPFSQSTLCSNTVLTAQLKRDI
jgi:hypothetical protein